jgi:hypothetical protein
LVVTNALAYYSMRDDTPDVFFALSVEFLQNYFKLWFS